jgi:hypothetical protein
MSDFLDRLTKEESAFFAHCINEFVCPGPLIDSDVLKYMTEDGIQSAFEEIEKQLNKVYQGEVLEKVLMLFSSIKAKR